MTDTENYSLEKPEKRHMGMHTKKVSSSIVLKQQPLPLMVISGQNNGVSTIMLSYSQKQQIFNSSIGS